MQIILIMNVILTHRNLELGSGEFHVLLSDEQLPCFHDLALHIQLDCIPCTQLGHVVIEVNP